MSIEDEGREDHWCAYLSAHLVMVHWFLGEREMMIRVAENYRAKERILISDRCRDQRCSK